MTPEQEAALLNFQAGNAQLPGSNANVVQVNTYPGCNQGGGVGPTQKSLPIDVSQANRQQCGIVSIFIDRTATTLTTARLLTLGGSVAVPSDAALAREYYNFPSTTTFLFDEDSANVIGGNEANYNPTVFLPFTDMLFANQHFMFCRLDAKDMTSTNSAFGTFKNNILYKRTLSIQGRWGTVTPSLEPAFCDPCISDNDNRASWIGYMPVSGNSMIAISLPAGLKAGLEFCVCQYENARNMTVCATV